jgi:hypothetical protein
MTHTPPPPQDDLAARYDTALREIRDLDMKMQNVWAVIDSFDNAHASPTSDQCEILDALRKALRT